jgi:hypothetical protein
MMAPIERSPKRFGGPNCFADLRAFRNGERREGHDGIAHDPGDHGGVSSGIGRVAARTNIRMLKATMAATATARRCRRTTMLRLTPSQTIVA